MLFIKCIPFNWFGQVIPLLLDIWAVSSFSPLYIELTTAF